ncbi:MAG TPA: DUF309 domain-containing protein [Dehalococcoidia bacterium]|nr:DUF309 domain-containing protein [Dehalococcoidia bacterium]
MQEPPRRRPGAPKGNLNALKHGLTSRQFARVGALLAADPRMRDVLLEMGRRHHLKQRRAQEVATVLLTRLMERAEQRSRGDLNSQTPTHDLETIRRAVAGLDPAVSAAPPEPKISLEINSRTNTTMPDQLHPLTPLASVTHPIPMPTGTELDALAKAVAEFNSWRFYDCHETLEDVWREVGGKSSNAELADFYQGIIKIAAGFHHVLRDNHRGAVLLLSDALRLLAPYPPRTLGIDLIALTEAVAACLQQIEALGPSRLREFDRGMIPSIEMLDGGAE